MNNGQRIKRKILIDSQTPGLFIGQPSEQAYDARAMAIAREGDIIITTSPIDPEYLSYWRGLGFGLPNFLHAGPFQPDKCLSTLILNNQNVRRELAQLNKEDYELHFFITVDGVEEKVAKELGFPAYVNFNFADRYRNKQIAKMLFAEAGVPTLPHLYSKDAGFSFEKCEQQLGKGPYLAKDIFGSGGKKLNTIIEFSNKEELTAIPFDAFIVERKINLFTEIACDWEMGYLGKSKLITWRYQLSENDSFCGTKFPVVVQDKLAEMLDAEYQKLTRSISAKGGLGHMSCDILIDQDMNSWWSDLNPRKAASFYVCQSVKDLMEIQGRQTPYYFHHKHAHTHSRGVVFDNIRKVLGDYLDPTKENFILVTNPNVIPYGTVDLTGVSRKSIEEATEILQNASTIIGSI